VPLAGVPFLRPRSAVGRSNEPKLRTRNQAAPRKLQHKRPPLRKQRRRLRRKRQRRQRPGEPGTSPRRNLLLNRLRTIGRRKRGFRRSVNVVATGGNKARAALLVTRSSGVATKRKPTSPYRSGPAEWTRPRSPYQVRWQGRRGSSGCDQRMITHHTIKFGPAVSRKDLEKAFHEESHTAYQGFPTSPK